MTRDTAGRGSAPESLQRLRLQLTVWYAGTFLAILLLLGVGMFAAITHRFDRELDESLRQATREVIRLARVRDRSPDRPAVILDPVADLRIPDRKLLVLDTLGEPLGPLVGEQGGAPIPWFREVARDAAAHGVVDKAHELEDGRILRAHGERFSLPDGRRLVAIAAADEIELEDRYASLIVAFVAAALIGLVLVAAGGWFLARQSTEPVEQAIAHMRRFMADAAHELRTPISVVRSRAEVALQRGRPAEEYVQALQGIERESERIGGIVEDLLTLARADAGERRIERQRVFLDDVALDAADAAHAIADRKAVRLDFDDFEEAAVDGDRALLRQLVMILLDNAIKFTQPHGSVRVSVRVRGDSPTLTVADTGVGIPAEHLSHVFERFFRGDPSRTRANGNGRERGGSDGAGLGLSIARWITDEHRGSIRIDSTPGQGTLIEVQFPPAVSTPNLSSS